MLESLEISFLVLIVKCGFSKHLTIVSSSVELRKL